MVEKRPRTLKVLEALSKMTEPSSPADIGIKIEVSPRDTGKTLYDLSKAGLAEKPDKNQSLWRITDKGRKHIENPPVPSGRRSNRPLRPILPKRHSPSLRSLTFSDPLGRSFEGNPRGNFTDYCNSCFNLGKQYLKQYMLKKRGYK